MQLALGALAFGVCLPAPAAVPVITNITMVAMVPRLTIHGDVGATNQVQYLTNLNQSTGSC